MKKSFRERIDRTKEALAQAEYIVVGGGAGLSAAAGLTYSGPRFTENFRDLIDRYGFNDMYTAGFFPFKTREEKWAYWSRHIFVNRFQTGCLQLYRQLLELIRNKRFFVITTNVDRQFFKAGFGNENIFAVQGDYGQFQCSKGCHNKLYDNEKTVAEMAERQQNCRIPTELIPVCPVCGADMEVHIRKDGFFVQDSEWFSAKKRYENFVIQARDFKTVLLELGVGFNTPTIIRFPFELLTRDNPHTALVRVNSDFPEPIGENESKTVSFDEDIACVISELGQET